MKHVQIHVSVGMNTAGFVTVHLRGVPLYIYIFFHIRI